MGTPNWKDRLDATRAAQKAARGGAGGGSGSGGGSGGGGGGSGGGGSGGGLGTGSGQQQSMQKLDIAGIWLWAKTPNKPSVEDKVGDGILAIRDAGDGIIEGVSLLELPLEKNPAKAAKVVMGIPLKGTFEGTGGDGEQAYRFLVIHPETGQVMTTRAVLSKDRKTLRGTSSSKTDRGTLEYEWTAIRLPDPEEK